MPPHIKWSVQLSKGAKQPKQQTQITKTEPWAGLQPYLTDLFARGKSEVLNNPQEFYPGQTYANMSPQTANALNAITQRALSGVPLIDEAAGMMRTTAGGQYLNQDNPALAGLTSALGDSIQRQVGSRFAGAGRTLGSPGEVQVFQRDLANAVAPQQFQNYQLERQLQEQAASRLAGLGSVKQGLEYQNLNALLGVGQRYDEEAAKKVADQVARWNFKQQEPQQRLAAYANLLGLGSPYSTSSGTTSTPGMGVGGMLGSGISGGASGAMSGAMLGSMFGPAGTGIGAGIGGLLGLTGGLLGGGLFG